MESCRLPTIPHIAVLRWRDDQVPELRLLCNSEKGVKQIHLVLLLMDYDATSKDDVMGSCNW